ncbi:MAG: hypothetical protein NC416_13120, partial [Eubacterium sp.]|nr:hypothetical protein [Eubacterium sp.]
PGLERFTDQPDKEIVSLYLEKINAKSVFVKEYLDCVHDRKIKPEFVDDVIDIGQCLGYENTSKIICGLCHLQKGMQEYSEIEKCVEEFLEEVACVQGSDGIDIGKKYKLLCRSSERRI